ncbi:glucose PTS transporter subunit IIA, partial [Enterococcus mundtii]|uniref:glucose PTS transporter subunit IIA n=2 Tax=Enterococcus TaxID=1350 RepID=UPI00036F1368
IIITGFLTFVVVGPVMQAVGDSLTAGLSWLYQTTGAIGLGIFGLFYSPIVITGLHQSFPAIETSLLADVARTGGTFIFPVASMANVGQGAATLAIMLLTKNTKQKSLATSASISALLGITEPAIFGVNLKLKFPFICGMIAAGISSMFIGFFHVLAIALGPASVIGFISITPNQIPFFMIGILISLLVGFTTTYLYGKKHAYLLASEEPETADVPSVAKEEEERVIEEVIVAPVSGELISLQAVNDPVFSQEMMGKGIAIRPTEGLLFAPADGELTVVYESKHAYGLKTDAGGEILIHIGIDTVELNGQGFSTEFQVGDKVKKGQLLGRFDQQKLKQAGYDDTVMVIITNSLSYESITPVTEGTVDSKERLLMLRSKTESN